MAWQRSSSGHYKNRWPEVLREKFDLDVQSPRRVLTQISLTLTVSCAFVGIRVSALVALIGQIGSSDSGSYPLSGSALMSALSVWWRGLASRIRAVSRRQPYRSGAATVRGVGPSFCWPGAYGRAVSLRGGGGHGRNRPRCCPETLRRSCCCEGLGWSMRELAGKFTVIGCSSHSLAIIEIYKDSFRYSIWIVSPSAFARVSTPACAGQYKRPRSQGLIDGWGAGGACRYMAPYSD